MPPLNRAWRLLLPKHLTFCRRLSTAICLLALISSVSYAADHRLPPHSVQNIEVDAVSQEVIVAALNDLNSAIRNHEAEAETPAFEMRASTYSRGADNWGPQPFDSAAVSPVLRDNTFTRYPDVKKWEEYFSGPGGKALDTAVERLGPSRERAEDIFAQTGLPRDLIVVGFVESGFVSDAVSSKGATGPWQFMPATAARYGLHLDACGDERKNFEKSTLAAAHYLADLHQLFGDWLLALAAYNAGEDRVQDAVRRGKTRDFWTLRRLGLLPLETQDYVPKVLGALQVWKGIAPNNREAELGVTADQDLSVRQSWVYTTTSGN